MFDSVLQQNQLPKGRWAASATATAGLHLAIAMVVFLHRANANRAQLEAPVSVSFVKPARGAAPPPPPPPPSGRHKMTPRSRPTPTPMKPIVQPKQQDEQKAPELEDEPPAADEEDDGVEGGVEGGVAGGVVGGVVGGVLGGTGTALEPPKRIEFNDSLPPIRRISGPDPVYTEKALEAEVEGSMVVKCVIGLDGAVRECRVLQGLPYMDTAVVEALQHRRYSPISLNGRSVEVDYTFKLKLNLPQ